MVVLEGQELLIKDMPGGVLLLLPQSPLPNLVVAEVERRLLV
jgi:hypothetical protein